MLSAGEKIVVLLGRMVVTPVLGKYHQHHCGLKDGNKNVAALVLRCPHSSFSWHALGSVHFLHSSPQNNACDSKGCNNFLT